MQFNDIRISRHDTARMLKVEFVKEEDTVVVSMRGAGAIDLTDDQAIEKARDLLGAARGSKEYPDDDKHAGTDQTLSQP